MKAQTISVMIGKNKIAYISQRAAAARRQLAADIEAYYHKQKGKLLKRKRKKYDLSILKAELIKREKFLKQIDGEQRECNENLKNKRDQLVNEIAWLKQTIEQEDRLVFIEIGETKK